MTELHHLIAAFAAIPGQPATVAYAGLRQRPVDI